MTTRLEILAGILALLWTFFKTTSWYNLRRESRIMRVYEALEVGVQYAWEKVIKPWLEKKRRTRPPSPSYSTRGRARSNRRRRPR